MSSKGKKNVSCPKLAHRNRSHRGYLLIRPADKGGSVVRVTAIKFMVQQEVLAVCDSPCCAYCCCVWKEKYLHVELVRVTSHTAVN